MTNTQPKQDLNTGFRLASTLSHALFSDWSVHNLYITLPIMPITSPVLSNRTDHTINRDCSPTASTQQHILSRPDTEATLRSDNPASMSCDRKAETESETVAGDAHCVRPSPPRNHYSPPPDVTAGRWRGYEAIGQGRRQRRTARPRPPAFYILYTNGHKTTGF